MYGSLYHGVGVLNFASSYFLSKNDNITFSGDVKWPDGEFAVPMSTLGCPDPTVNTWRYGYMNISFKDETDLFEMSVGRVGWNGSRMNPIELVGPYGSHSIQLNFCYKFEEEATSKQEWPPGGYSLYGSGDGCPSGDVVSFIFSLFLCFHFKRSNYQYPFCLLAKGGQVNLFFLRFF